MPYIKQEKRVELDGRLADIMEMPLSEGELNYLITKLCLAYIENHGESYATCNAVVGVLECAKLEFYRRLVALYEDCKIVSNGDVYDVEP